MRQNAFRNAFLGLLMSFMAALLAACGGGSGASADSAAQGGILILGNGANASTAYAGVPFTLQIFGGKPPYTLTTTEPTIFPVPTTTTSNTVIVVPTNPSTVDNNLQAGELPVRTVSLTVRDTSTQTAFTQVKVAQNFLYGYGIALTPTTCPTGTGGSANSACSGGETALRFLAATNGGFAVGRTFTITNLKGHYSLRNPATGQTGNTVQAVADSNGRVTVIVQVPPNTQTEIGVIRIQDTATGLYNDNAFVIAGVAGSTTGVGDLTVIPNAVTYTGPLKGICGTGTATVLVFDGTPPYTATASDPNVIVSVVDANHQPGSFTVTAWNPNICLTDSTVTFADSLNRRATMKVSTKEGQNDPPKLSVAPTSVTLTCGATATVSVAGGSGNYSAASTLPRVVAFPAGNSVGITRVTGDGTTNYGTTGTVSITDGISVVAVDVTSPPNCP